MDVIQGVREYLDKQLRVADAMQLDPKLPLLGRGVIDSIELMEIVGFLERTHGIAVDDTEILPENLGSLSAIAGFVARKKSA